MESVLEDFNIGIQIDLSNSENYADINDFDCTIALSKRYFDADSQNAMPLVGRGKPYLQLNNLGHAKSNANRVIQSLETSFCSDIWVDPRPETDLPLSDAHKLLGDAYAEEGENDKAQNEYQLASQLV